MAFSVGEIFAQQMRIRNAYVSPSAQGSTLPQVPAIANQQPLTITQMQLNQLLSNQGTALERLGRQGVYPADAVSSRAVGKPFPNVAPTPTTPAAPSSPVGRGFSLPPSLAVAGMLLGRGYMLLDAIPTFQGVGDGLGYLWNLPQNIGNAFEKRRLDHLLKQREAQAIDRARINNASKATITLPPFTGGQSVGIAYSLLLGAEYTDNSGTFQVRWLLNGIRRFTAFNGEFTDAQIRASASLTGAISVSDVQLQGQVVYIRGTVAFDGGLPDLKNFRIIKVLTTDGQPDTGGNLPTQTTYDNPPPVPPPYPNRDTWLYGSKDVQSPYGIQELSKKSWNEQAVKPFPQPSIKPFERSSAVTPFKEPDKQIDVAQPDTSKNPSIAKSPSGFNFVPSVNNNQTVNNNFIGSNNSPSTPQQQAKPKDSPTPDVFEQAKADFDKYYSVGYGMFNTSGVQGIVAGVNSSYGAKPSDANGAKAFIAVKQKEAQVYDKPTQTTPNKPTVTPDKRSPNTTPTTPTTDNKNDSNFAQTIASLIGLTALVAAMKLGSDAFVNASLPKINNIDNNTSPQAQQTNAATGACTALNSPTCTTGLKDSIVNPINQNANANQALNNANNAVNDLALKGIAANQVGQNTTLAGITSTLGTVLKFAGSLYNNQFVQSSINYLTLATTLHNAAMLTRDIEETLGEVVDNGLTLAGRQFKDSEGNQVQFSEFVGSNAKALISSIIGADKYAELTLKWQKASAIFNSAANVLNTTQSMLDPLSSAIEYGMENVSKIGNSLKEDGVVSENAYPSMDETIRARRTSRFAKLADTLEGSEQIVSNLSSVTSSAVSVKEDFKQLREDKKALTDSAAAFNTVKADELATIKASIPVMSDLSLAPAPDTD